MKLSPLRLPAPQVERTDSRATYSTVTSYTVANGTAGKTGTLLLSLQVAVLDLAGRTTSTIRYANVGTTSESDLIADLNKNMPLSGGTSYTTTYGYDAMGRQNMVKDAVGTITRIVYDGLGRVASTWIGTNDAGATDSAPHSATAGNNMTEVSSDQYDDGNVGDGNLTKATLYVSDPNATGHNASTDRVTTNYFDWQDRQVASDNTISTTYNTLDNLGEVTDQKIYDDSVATMPNTTTNGMPNAPASSALRAETVTKDDSRGRVYETDVDNIAQQTGLSSSNISVAAGANLGQLKTILTYDARDNMINEVDPGGLMTRSRYDGAGRLTYQGQGTAGMDLTSKNYAYDADDNVIVSTDMEYNPGGTAFTTYVANYYDAANRLTDTVNYGTNGGTAMTAQPALPVQTDNKGARPATWITAVQAATYSYLITSYRYDSNGYLENTTNPNGIITHRKNDALGRVVQQFQNYGDGSGSITNNYKVATGYTYDGLDHTLTVSTINVSPIADPTTGILPSTTAKTTYTYNSNGDHNNDLLTQVTYADGSTQTTTYDNIGEVASVTHAGVTHTYKYNVLGQLVSDTASLSTTNPPAIDMTVTQLTYTYNTLGLVVLATSLNASGAPVNQVENIYNGFGQLSTQYQENSGPVKPSTSLKVSYAYTSSSTGSLLQSVTYPDIAGTSTPKVITYNYNGLDAIVGRISAIQDNTGIIEYYTYQGLDAIVGRYLSEPDINEKTKLDQFGRIENVDWTQNGSYSSTIDLDQFSYTYNADNSVLTRNVINTADNETYGYDALDRQTSFTVAGTADPQTNPLPSSASWTLDSDGNRYGGKYGNSYNSVSEVNISSRSLYSLGGNTTSITFADGTTVALKYDAWGRVVGTDTISTRVSYQYDALGRRISSKDAQSGALLTRDFYDGNNLIEERDTTTGAITQYVWSDAGGNHLVLRDQSGVVGIPSRFYALTDAAGSVTSIVGQVTSQAWNNWNVIERYLYDQDGRTVAAKNDWSIYTNTNATSGVGAYGWDILYHGIRFRELYQVQLNGSQTFVQEGLYEGIGGSWYDPQDGHMTTPNPSAPVSQSAYDPSTYWYDSLMWNAPNPLERLVPLWGSWLAATYAEAHGDTTGAVINSAFFVLDAVTLGIPAGIFTVRVGIPLASSAWEGGLALAADVEDASGDYLRALARGWRLAPAPDMYTPSIAGGVQQFLDRLAFANRFARLSNELEWLDEGSVQFRGKIVQVTEDLTHLTKERLLQMFEDGTSPQNIEGEIIHMHHVGQNVDGALWELAESTHLGTPELHPLGNAAGVGLTLEERAEFDVWRNAYWQRRAAYELLSRGAL